MKTFAIATLGCKVNTYESQGYVQSLKKYGYKEVDFKEIADIYIINTCAVTNKAASKSRQKINQARKTNPNAYLCVVGCFVQVDPKSIDVDLVVGASDKDKVGELIHSHVTNYTVRNSRLLETFDVVEVDKFEHQSRAFLKIQDGCNNFCSFCIIPFARGAERSMDETQVLSLATTLLKSHREIVLTGIQTGRYGEDLGTDLTSLLYKMVELPNIERIRISSIEFNQVTDEMIALIKENPIMARHLHIPIQAGSNHILKKMRRHYNIEEFIERIDWIKKEIPDISISTDLIVGFPGEDEELFEETLQTLKRVDFSFLHVFPYSKRDKTLAAAMDNHLSNIVKKERVQKVIELSNEGLLRYSQRFLNRTLDVLIETDSKHGFVGHSSEYLKVIVKDATKEQLHKMVKVKITAIQKENLEGYLEEAYVT